MRRIAPATDDGRHGSGIDKVGFLHYEVGPLKEGGHGSAQQQRAQYAVQHQEPLEGLGTQQIAQLVLELIAHGLEHKREENDHPQPVGSAKRRAIKQGERGKEGSTESDERGECEFPLTARAVDHQSAPFSCPA